MILWLSFDILPGKTETKVVLLCGFGCQVFWPAYMNVQSKHLQQVVSLSGWCLDIWKASQLLPTSSCSIPAQQPSKIIWFFSSSQMFQKDLKYFGKGSASFPGWIFLFSHKENMSRDSWQRGWERDSKAMKQESLIFQVMPSNVWSLATFLSLGEYQLQRDNCPHTWVRSSCGSSTQFI